MYLSAVHEMTGEMAVSLSHVSAAEEDGETVAADVGHGRKARDPGGDFRPLWWFDRADYLGHLHRLSLRDRRSRFHAEISDDGLAAHADNALRGRARVIGWWKDGVLRGAAELALSHDGASAEGAFEVEEPFRGRGVGSALVGAALLWARNRGARRLLIHTSRRNVPMLKAAARYDAAFEFDLADAEGVIRAHAPTMFSHAQEALEVESALARLALRRSFAVFRRLAFGAPVACGFPSALIDRAGEAEPGV
ncbi:MAG: GNAT family N-acetyltransferase [Rubrimonas sp.]